MLLKRVWAARGNSNHGMNHEARCFSACVRRIKISKCSSYTYMFVYTRLFFLREVHLFYTGTLVSGKRRVLWKTAVPTVKPQQERKFSFSQTATPLRRLAPTVVQTVKYYFPASLFLFKLFIPIQLNKGLLLNYLEEGRTSSNWVNKKIIGQSIAVRADRFGVVKIVLFFLKVEHRSIPCWPGKLWITVRRGHSSRIMTEMMVVKFVQTMMILLVYFNCDVIYFKKNINKH